ncbi:tRNA glutamyl-Q(34) synthetase GluQRS [Fulvimarina endophytica]|uniref:tRNA glutamyl-Q(34) synthetase GluQRS n=1 Tax=Fulvimarina endophytica TaxID=2293836 RepID=A0A371X1F8_9HYPH|nr:tRNA glutamyl-Q(34) synthetase GluQRS [Fulvimarina endophytica]RFC62864.1 tRNA glutamyl-Q(34) synthetase GluQRS [Fulvimarina endophytica]
MDIAAGAREIDHSTRVFRFAPSPNGELHLGHAYSALLNHRLARENHARFLLRLEDIDLARCSHAYEEQIVEDLHFLKVDWDETRRRQSDHFDVYAKGLDVLRETGLCYRGFMTRGEIRRFAELRVEETGDLWPRDPDGSPLYPGLDRRQPAEEQDRRARDGESFAWRIDVAAAVERTGPLEWEEWGRGPDGESGRVVAKPAEWGDFILARRDVPTSYHLAVVVDDAIQGVTDVVRGRDLFYATSAHRLLQDLLGLPAPRYHHHDLILAEDGRKLSKSARDTSIRSLREAGLQRADIVRMLGLEGVV